MTLGIQRSRNKMFSLIIEDVGEGVGGENCGV